MKKCITFFSHILVKMNPTTSSIYVGYNASFSCKHGLWNITSISDVLRYNESHMLFCLSAPHVYIFLTSDHCLNSHCMIYFKFCLRSFFMRVWCALLNHFPSGLSPLSCSPYYLPCSTPATPACTTINLQGHVKSPPPSACR